MRSNKRKNLNERFRYRPRFHQRIPRPLHPLRVGGLLQAAGFPSPDLNLRSLKGPAGVHLLLADAPFAGPFPSSHRRMGWGAPKCDQLRDNEEKVTYPVGRD